MTTDTPPTHTTTYWGILQKTTTETTTTIGTTAPTAPTTETTETTNGCMDSSQSQTTVYP